ncbi:NAD-dependent protein deacetylase sirtuin-2 [Chionoecetes opilio]|uniref:NAD-dependent protein deacetylase sirtuin-2 n=1 Tax=Chionoecetes opilio TaxID=41210 RepID=A0A8J5CGW6_CHIOP|nr:NAD-dependent protein deacetylase sirtuin-2 [Chionoecetes opilio]
MADSQAAVKQGETAAPNKAPEAATSAPADGGTKCKNLEGAMGGMRDPSKTKEQEESDEEECDENELEDDDDDDDDDDDEEGFMGMLQNFLRTKLDLGGGGEGEKVLDEVSVEGVVKYIKSGKCKNIITMAGAGISTSAGIPDFRSPGTGLYCNLEKYNLPFPEAIFDIEFFKVNPKPFFVLAKDLYPGAFNPTPSHWFIRLLHEKGLLLRHYTQNIDTLEHVAGLPAEKVVEAHGTFRTSHCIGCQKEYTQDWLKEEIFKDLIPKCEECNNLVKPDIVFFREDLPAKFFELTQSDFPKCDLLLILGTSLTVQPFAMLINNVPPSCPRLLINREKAGSGDPMMGLLHGMLSSSGLALDSPRNIRDVALLGDCDQGCAKLADLLGWKDEYEKLIPCKAEKGEKAEE